MLDQLWLQLVASFVVTFVVSKVLLSVAKPSKVPIKPELLATQWGKQGTPVIGGVAFCLGTLATTLFNPALLEPTILLPVSALFLYGLLGLLDDWLKRKSFCGDGLPSLTKLALQACLAVLFLSVMQKASLLDTKLAIAGFSLELGVSYYLFALLYILYFVNAVNITDGLDALAGGSSIPLLLLLLLLSYQQGMACSPSLLGSLLAFLVFNIRPAQYFMGDCGSHALGSYIAVSAVLLNAELILFFASGLFLVELGSSLIQIISIRKFGRKVFPIAPLHHAYELKGVQEGYIVLSFTLVSWMFGAGSLLLSR